MSRNPLLILGTVLAVFGLFDSIAAAEESDTGTSLVISVAEQKLALLRDGGLIKKYPISTSKFGLGDSFGSYKTPVGKLRVCDKVGDELAVGAVLKQRHATGEVLPVNAPGRDPIVTRILWLDGLEEQNRNARSRGIYIHGTTEENRIGEAVSYGCIRMRSKDVSELFEEVPIEAEVAIIAEKFPRFPKYAPPKHPVIAKAVPEPAGKVAAATAKETSVITIALAKPSPPLNPIAAKAMMGSMLMAGTAEGPSIPTLPPPPAPKDVLRFSPMVSEPAAGPAKESAFSLQGIARDLSPAIRAAEMAARQRETLKAESAAEAAAKAEPRVAFRTNQAASPEIKKESVD